MRRKRRKAIEWVTIVITILGREACAQAQYNVKMVR